MRAVVGGCARKTKLRRSFEHIDSGASAHWDVMSVMMSLPNSTPGLHHDAFDAGRKTDATPRPSKDAGWISMVVEEVGGLGTWIP